MTEERKSQKDNESAILRKAVTDSMKKAFRENRALGFSFLVARNGKLIRINGKDDDKVVGTTDKPVKIEKQVYKLD